MKLSLVLFLTVAICASVSYAYPEPQPDPFAEALAEAFPGDKWDKVKKFVGKVFEKLCKDDKDNNKCKDWAKKNINSENIRKVLLKFEDEINGFCDEAKNIIVKGGCKLLKNFMKEGK